VLQFLGFKWRRKKKYIVSLAVLANRYKEYENFLVIFVVIVDRISSTVLGGVSHEGRLISRCARNQEQEGNRDVRVRQVWAISVM